MQSLKRLFEGRLSRNHFFLGSIGAGIIFGFITSVSLMFLMARLLNSAVDLIPFFIFAFICWLPMLLAVSSLALRRLHDMNIDGRYFVIFTVPYFISIVIGGKYNGDYANILFTALMYLLLIEWLFLVLLPGTEGSNKYGPKTNKDTKFLDAILNRQKAQNDQNLAN